jgi:hypothetical protein
VSGSQNCGSTGIGGFVKHGGGEPFLGISVGVWSDAWVGAVSAPSELDGKYTVDFVPPGSLKVAVVARETCVLNADGLPTANRCRLLSNAVEVAIFDISKCNDANAPQWAEVHFQGP